MGFVDLFPLFFFVWTKLSREALAACSDLHTDSFFQRPAVFPSLSFGRRHPQRDAQFFWSPIPSSNENILNNANSTDAKKKPSVRL